MKVLFTFICFLISVSVSSQVLNAESLRKVTDTSGFSGAASVNFALKRNTNDFLTLGSDIHIQYKMNNYLILFKNEIDFQKIENEDFSNSLISHVRYNHKISPVITWEVFGQAQYNKINLIDFRGLLGTGPRFKLTQSEKYKFYLGTLIMFEYEEVADGVTPLQRDIRGSTYLSFSLYPTDNLTFISTTYYQPKLGDISDHRISSQSSLLVDLFTNFALKTTYTFVYDEKPAIGIPSSQYSFTTGVSYSFD